MGKFLQLRNDFKPRSVRAVMVMLLLVIMLGIISSGFEMREDVTSLPAYEKDSTASVKAFDIVYKVLMNPRCMNCHPSGDIPLQGNDSHLHTMAPKRGGNGKGLYAMKCTNCHQPSNTPGMHTPPGNPKWQLPPADMKMVFQGKSARQLALQIMDYNKNGHKNKAQLLEHARDTLVKAGWNMGQGRPAPPIAYNDFVKAWDTWINNGGYAPGK